MARLRILVASALLMGGASSCRACGEPASSDGRPAGADAEPPGGPGSKAHLWEGTLTGRDGRTRSYWLHAPDRPSGSRRPLMIVLHGGGGNAEGAARTSFTPEAAEEHDYIAVYPEGIGKERLGHRFATWNGGYCCGRAAEEGVDDSAFLTELLDHLADEIAFDDRRVYVTGISNGGIMAMRFACDHPERVAGISSVAGPGYIGDCVSPKPVRVQIIHGTEDRCAHFDGGQACGGCWERAFEAWLGVPIPERTFPCTSALDQVAFWRKVNRCTDEATVTHREGGALCTEYRACESGQPVGLCVIEGGGHTWPGASRDCDETGRACKAFAEVTGPISRDLDANAAMVSFFETGRAE